VLLLAPPPPPPGATPQNIGTHISPQPPRPPPCRIPTRTVGTTAATPASARSRVASAPGGGTRTQSRARRRAAGGAVATAATAPAPPAASAAAQTTSAARPSSSAASRRRSATTQTMTGRPTRRGARAGGPRGATTSARGSAAAAAAPTAAAVEAAVAAAAAGRAAAAVAATVTAQPTRVSRLPHASGRRQPRPGAAAGALRVARSGRAATGSGSAAPARRGVAAAAPRAAAATAAVTAGAAEEGGRARHTWPGCGCGQAEAGGSCGCMSCAPAPVRAWFASASCKAMAHVMAGCLFFLACVGGPGAPKVGRHACSVMRLSCPPNTGTVYYKDKPLSLLAVAPTSLTALLLPCGACVAHYQCGATAASGRSCIAHAFMRRRLAVGGASRSTLDQAQCLRQTSPLNRSAWREHACGGVGAKGHKHTLRTTGDSRLAGSQACRSSCRTRQHARRPLRKRCCRTNPLSRSPLPLWWAVAWPSRQPCRKRKCLRPPGCGARRSPTAPLPARCCCCPRAWA
jgi:hypothetical protein